MLNPNFCPCEDEFGVVRGTMGSQLEKSEGGREGV